MVYIKYILLIFIATSICARTKLLEYSAKQTIHNIKFSFKDNDSSFYQKGKDTLAFTSNFKSFEVLQEKHPTEFQVETQDRKLFIITAKTQHHDMLMANKDGNIYLYNVEKKKLEKVGRGVNATIAQSGKYLSYYNFDEKIIVIKKTLNLSKTTNIPIHGRGPFYIPKFTITDDGILFYTDYNKDNFLGIRKFDLDLNKRETLFKARDLGVYLELCNIGNEVRILESGYTEKTYANIYSIPSRESDISKRKFLFSSTMGPSHNLICEKENTYFIKSIKGKTSNLTELLRYDHKEKKTFIHSDLSFVTSAIVLNDEVLIPFRKKVYTIKDKKGFIVNKELVENNE